MDIPHFPPTSPRQIPGIVAGDEGYYLVGTSDEIGHAAMYALALQQSIEDAALLLEPRLPPAARPYLEVFERYVLANAEQLMAQWTGEGAVTPD